MNVDYLIQLINQHPQFRELLQSIRDGKRTTQVEGLAVAAKSVLVSALQDSEKRPILLVSYNYEQAERLYEDIGALGFGNGDVVLVPPADGMIYQERNSDADVIGSRLDALSRLQSGQARVVVAPIAAVLQRTLPPELLAQHRITIAKGQELEPNKFGRKLVKFGYTRVEMVENPGEFSQRGGIIDVFASTEDHPVRIDLWGDEIESICKFDTESQRSAGERKSVDILPAREILLDDERAETAAEFLRRQLLTESERIEEEYGRIAANQLRDRVENDIARIEQKAYFDGIEYYFPAAFAGEYSLLDYLPAESIVILDEPHQIKSHWEQLHETLLTSLNERIKRGETLALPCDHVISFETFAHSIETRHQNVLMTLLPRPLSWLKIDAGMPINASPMDSFCAQIGALTEQLKTWRENKCRIVLITTQQRRVVEILNEQGFAISPVEDMPKPGIYVLDGDVRAGFKMPDARLMVLTYGEIFGFTKARRPKKTFRKGMAVSSLLELKEGDYVVHINHGIGRYLGATKLAGANGDRDYLLVQYAGTDKLYVPTNQIDRIQKYIGADGDMPTLNKLGGTDWAKATKKVKESVREMAKELVALYAARQAVEGHAFGPDTPWQQEMESAFPYEETPDQLVAIQEVKADLEAAKPMDRLICGDVGYGKTEVAMRAVFKVVNDGKQAVVLCPTTVLAQQHYNTFLERFAPYPVTVGMMSRFASKSEQKKTIEGLRTGDVDIVVGTHRLLSKDIEFKDLGLVVVDEEHRFGVAHKERLKQLRTSVDVLTLTATPIPRTLHMSLSGIRDMSLINDPPEGRTPVRTHCAAFDDELVRDAILAELDRNGQVFFVHNRVENIEYIADHIRTLIPYAKVGVGHGQMDEDDLEQVMVDFYERKYDVLVCTTIIESGLDVPNVNTIIINNADKMGLAQLYQLRGRVGRSNRQAYAYLLYEPHRVMTEIAEKRLDAIKEFTDLGSGFKVSLRDLEIRGAGNLLGAEQHGQMASVGFDMYCQLLSEAIVEEKGEEPKQFQLPAVDLPMDAYIPTKYIPTESMRLSFYKKMTAVRDMADVDNLQDEMRERFGELPKPVENSLDILRLRLQTAGTGIEAITSESHRVIIKFGTGIRLAGDVIVGLKRRFAGTTFQPERVLINDQHPNLIGYLSNLLSVLPKSLEDSKAVFMAKIY